MLIQVGLVPVSTNVYISAFVDAHEKIADIGLSPQFILVDILIIKTIIIIRRRRKNENIIRKKKKKKKRKMY